MSSKSSMTSNDNSRADSSATQDFFDESNSGAWRTPKPSSGYSHREPYRERFNSNESHVFSDKSGENDKILMAWREKPNNAQ